MCGCGQGGASSQLRKTGCLGGREGWRRSGDRDNGLVTTVHNLQRWRPVSAVGG